MRRRLQVTILLVGTLTALGLAAAAIYAGQNAEECGPMLAIDRGRTYSSFGCSVTGWGTAEPYLWLGVLGVVMLSAVALIATRLRQPTL